MPGSDLYSALIGAPVDSAEKQAALADLLRRKAGFAQVAQLSGDPNLAPMGQQNAQTVGQQAQQLQRGQQNAQEMAFQKQQEARQAAAQQQQLAQGQEQLALTRRGQDLDYRGGLEKTLLALRAAEEKEKNKPLTDTQANAQAMLGRMQKAEKLIGLKGTNAIDYAAAGSIYGGGGALTSTLANKAMSKEGASYYQAAADWVRAKLRKESGASIADNEMSSELRTYFPIPGDGPEQIAQKAAARKEAEAELLMMGGGTSHIPKDEEAPKRRKFNPATGKIE